ncbi:MAG: MATE family efflux transporter [Saezia sp.]
MMPQSHSSDFKKIGQQAFSILIGQWAIVGFALVDGAIAGHIDKTELAALSIGAAIYLTVFVTLLGIMQALLPIAGQLFGAGRYAEIGYQTRQNLYFAGWVSFLGFLCLVFPKPLLIIADIDQEREALVQSYLSMLAIGFIPAVYFRIYVALSQAISRPFFVTILQIAALLLKIPLAWFFAFKLEMGIAGCGLSTSIISCILFLVGFVMLFKLKAYSPLQLFKKIERPKWKDQKDLMQLGIPIGISSFIEVAGSTFMVLLVARFQSDLFSSAHQLMILLSATIFQIPLSVGIASSATVAQYIGARKLYQARNAGFFGIKMGIGLTLLASLLIFVLRYTFFGSLTDKQDVLNLAAALTGFVILYQILDAAQITPALILRAYKVAIVPTFLYIVALWGVGLGGGYLIAFNYFGLTPLVMQSPAGFWFASAMGLGISAITLIFLFHFVSQKKMNDMPTAG